MVKQWLLKFAPEIGTGNFPPYDIGQVTWPRHFKADRILQTYHVLPECSTEIEIQCLISNITNY